MKKTLISLLLFVGLGLIPCLAQGTALSQTTLSAAIGSQSRYIVVASATGITANNTYLYIDTEFMSVVAVNSTTIQVVRGQGGTAASGHINAAPVYLGAANYFVTSPQPLPAGACTRANIPALPQIDTRTGTFSDCLGGQWIQGQQVKNTPFRLAIPDTGGTAYTSINTNGTTLSATTQYCTEVNLPFSKYLTGIAVLNGTTAAGTDKHIVALYDNTGVLLANSATAGTASATASNYQAIAFTTPFYAVGPQQYFACLQTNGTTDTVRMVVTGTQDMYLTKGVTGQTFGTLVSITVPTTFTTAVGPYVELY